VVKKTKKRKITPKTDSDRLDEVIRLLQILVASNLNNFGFNQTEIAKNLGVAKASVNKILKGANKEK